MTKNERKLGDGKDSITVILPEGEKWIDQCKEGEDGWDLSDGMLRKVILGKEVTLEEVQSHLKVDKEKYDKQTAIDSAAAQKCQKIPDVSVWLKVVTFNDTIYVFDDIIAEISVADNQNIEELSVRMNEFISLLAPIFHKHGMTLNEVLVFAQILAASVVYPSEAHMRREIITVRGFEEPSNFDDVFKQVI
jgi:hypothetical protein